MIVTASSAAACMRVAAGIVALAVCARAAHAQRADSAATSSTAAARAKLSGVVVSAETGEPINGAQVILLGLDQQLTTGASGRFDFGAIDAGSYVVQARMLGFKPYTVRANLAASASLELNFKLNKGAVQLTDLESRAVVRRSPFMERMETSNGMGSFVTAADIERRGLRIPSDIFRAVPGARITCGGGTAGSACQIRISRSQGLSQANSDCPPLFFLNGARSDIELMETGSIPIYDIEGAEVYRGNGETPAEYSVAGSGCGVIAVWTKTGRK